MIECPPPAEPEGAFRPAVFEGGRAACVAAIETYIALRALPCFPRARPGLSADERVILTCPECTTRYHFDETRVPERGLAVRCKRCRAVFRATRHAPAGPASLTASGPGGSQRRVPEARQAVPVHAGEHGLGARGRTEARAIPAAADGAQAHHAGMAAETQSQPRGPTAVPVTVIPSAPSQGEEDIRRLTRIILSDIMIYSPERAERAIREGRFVDLYRSEIEEGRKMIRSRFSGTSASVETYERSLKELLEARRRELQQSAEAL